MTNPTTCPIDGWHCENCGSTDGADLAGDDGYTDCCNEIKTLGHDCRCHHLNND